MTQTPRTTAEINARRQAIGAELAKGRIVPVKNARELEREDDALRIAYLEAEAREGEAALIAQRVEKARREKAAQEREPRIAKAIAEAL
jgi:hypothetical protein